MVMSSGGDEPYTDIPYISLGKTGKGGKFLKKLWCCVGGSITR